MSGYPCKLFAQRTIPNFLTRIWAFLVGLAPILTIIVGIVTYYFTNQRDQEIKIAEHANKVRQTAAQVLGKTQALRDALSFAKLDAEHNLVATKVALYDDYSIQKKLHGLWGLMRESEAKALRDIASLQTDPNYLALFTYRIDAKRCFEPAINKVKDRIRDRFKTVLDSVEVARKEMADTTQAQYSAVTLHNFVIDAVTAIEPPRKDKTLPNEIEKAMAPLEKELIEMISWSNKTIFESPAMHRPFPCD